MFISDTIKTEVITVTPRLAKQLLDHNTNNRKVSKANLEKIKASMLESEWELNGEAIKIAQNGRILDGQHRLQASVETDTTFSTFIVYGLKNTAQDTMGTGKSRSLADVLSIHGYKNTNRLAAIVVAIMRAEKGGLRQGVRTESSNSISITNKQALTRLEIEPTLADISHVVHPAVKAGMPGRLAGLLYYEFSKISGEDTEDFFARLASGIGLDRGDPILTLRDHLTRLRSESHRKPTQIYIAAVIIKAWNKYREGEPMQKIGFRVGGANPERFPEPH